MQVSAQQLATAKTREQDLRIQRRVRERETRERFFNSSRGSDTRIGAFAREPGKIFRILFESLSRAADSTLLARDVCEQRGLFEDRLMSARLLFRRALDKETGAILIGQIAEQKFEVSLGTYSKGHTVFIKTRHLRDPRVARL